MISVNFYIDIFGSLPDYRMVVLLMFLFKKDVD